MSIFATPYGGNCVFEVPSEAYTPPDGDAVAFADIPYTGPDIKFVRIENLSAVGIPQVTQGQVVRAVGIGATATGEPYTRRVWNYIIPYGFSSHDVGLPVAVYRQFITALSGITPTWCVSIQASVLYEGQYTPPPGDPLIFECGAGYVAPPGDPLILEMGAVGTGRIPWVSLQNTSSYGTPTVKNQFYPVFAYGERYVEFGTPTISNLGRRLIQTTPWWQPPHFSAGTPTVENLAYGIRPGGIASAFSLSTDHWISYRTRVLSASGLAPGTFPDPIVTHDIQFVDQAGRGPDTASFGTATFDLFIREIAVPWIASNVFGRATVGRATYVEVGGIPEPAAMFGTPITTHDGQFVFTDTAVSIAEYGLPTIRNDRLYITFTERHSWVDGFVEFPTVLNKTRFLSCSPYEDQLLGGAPPNWFGRIYVENKNKVLAPDGKPQQKFGYTYIWNAASPIFPAGFDSFTPKGISDTFISYVNREVLPEPWDSFFNTRWSVVWNAAVPLYASPLAPSTSWGRAEVINANRFIRLAAIDNQVLGTAFIADRIRTVYPRPMWDAPTAFPDVRINPYPITAPGIFSTAFGSTNVFIHWTIFWPKGIKPKDIQCGEPVVENQFKTLTAWPWNSEWYGVPSIKNQITYLNIGGYDLTLFGAVDISYRTKRINPIGIGAITPTHLNTIRNLLPDLPAVQRVFQVYDGSWQGQTLFGTLTLPFVTIIPKPYDDVGGFGTSVVTTNVLIPRSFFLEQDGPQLGVPVLIFTRYLYPESLPPYVNALSGDSEVGRPRLSPHTIYGPICNIAQAINNHPCNQHYVDSEVRFSPIGGAFYPYHSISLLNRTIYPNTTPFWDNDTPRVTDARYGTPEIFNKNRTIAVRGYYSQRIPTPMFLGVPQWITFDDTPWPPSLAFGTASVAPPPAQQPAPFADPVGSDMTLWGATLVQLFNRSVTVEGIPHNGTYQFWPIDYFNNPVTPNHQVGYHRSRFIEGSDFTIWGTAWISHRIRTFQFDGFDALQMDFWQTRRSDRMHLSLINPPKFAVGVPPSLVFGTTWVSCGTRYIEPQGRDWSYFTPFGVAQSIAAQGFESMEIGDVDKWEEGKLKPHGDDLSFVGEPHMAQTITPDSNDVSDFGTSTLSFILTCWGFPPVGFDGPVVTNPDGCGLRYAIPSGAGATVFGVASIA